MSENNLKIFELNNFQAQLLQNDQFLILKEKNTLTDKKSSQVIGNILDENM